MDLTKHLKNSFEPIPQKHLGTEIEEEKSC